MDRIEAELATARTKLKWAQRALNTVDNVNAVSYTHLRAHETVLDIVCRLLLEKKKITSQITPMHVT